MQDKTVKFTHEKVELPSGRDYHVLSPQNNIKIWFRESGDYASFELNSCDIDSQQDIEGLFIFQDGAFFPLTRVLSDAKNVIDEVIKEYYREYEEELSMAKELRSPYWTGRV